MTAVETRAHIDRFVEWPEIERLGRQLAARLRTEQPALVAALRGIVGIARGGLIPAVVVARELGIRRVDSVSIASYDHQSQGKAEALNRLDHDGEGFLIVDDLSDTGQTLRLVRDMLPKAPVATLFVKPAGAPLVDYWMLPLTQETWVHFPWERDAVDPAEPFARL